MIQRANYTGNPNPDVGGETEFFNCNFGQPAPVLEGSLRRGVRLFPGDDTPRTFTDCALVNCEPPPGSTVVGGNTCIKEYYLETDTETITVDGEVLTIQHHVDLVYGRWTPEGYEDKPVPEEVQRD